MSVALIHSEIEALFVSITTNYLTPRICIQARKLGKIVTLELHPELLTFNKLQFRWLTLLEKNMRPPRQSLAG